jgi:Flp pilus assembly protein CpaB
LRLSASHVLIAVLVILAFVLNLLVLRDRSTTVLVAIADSTLVEGSALDLDQIRLTPIDTDFPAVGSFLGEIDVDAVEGWILGRTIAEGEVVDRASLVAPSSSPGLRSMSLPIPIEHAAGGQLAPGDRVDVISVTDGVAKYVAVDLPVSSVAEQAGGALGAGAPFHVVVAVDAEQALLLAAAMAEGPIELLESTGASPAEIGAPDG